MIHDYEMVKENNNLKLEVIKEYNDCRITDPKDIATFINNTIGLYRKVEEELKLIAINNNGDIKGLFTLSKGDINSSVGNKVGLFQRMLLTPSCKNFILVHNHPSNNVEPSSNDIKLTKEVKEGAKLLGLELLDHIIIGTEEGKYKSLKTMGVIK